MRTLRLFLRTMQSVCSRERHSQSDARFAYTKYTRGNVDVTVGKAERHLSTTFPDVQLFPAPKQGSASGPRFGKTRPRLSLGHPKIDPRLCSRQLGQAESGACLAKIRIRRARNKRYQQSDLISRKCDMPKLDAKPSPPPTAKIWAAAPEPHQADDGPWTGPDQRPLTSPIAPESRASKQNWSSIREAHLLSQAALRPSGLHCPPGARTRGRQVTRMRAVCGGTASPEAL